MSARDRALAITVSGPLGRTVAFVIDLAVVLWRVARGDHAGPRDR